MYGEGKTFLIKLLKANQNISNNFKTDIYLATIEFLKLIVNPFKGSFLIHMSSLCINNFFDLNNFIFLLIVYECIVYLPCFYSYSVISHLVFFVKYLHTFQLYDSNKLK